MAGILRFDDTEQIETANWQRVVDINLTGTMFLCRAALPHLLESKGSIVNAGMDPENLEQADKSKMDFASGSAKAKAWKDIWGAGQGVGSVHDVPPVRDLVLRMEQEYNDARKRLAG